MSNTNFGSDNAERKTETLKDAALDAAHGVKREAASFAADAQDRLADRLDDRKDQAVLSLHVFADAIRAAGDELSKNDQSMAGQAVKRAADGLEGLSRSVSDKSPEDLLTAVRQFGRDNPVAFAGAAVLLGVALGRVARSSATDASSAATGSPTGVTGAARAPMSSSSMSPSSASPVSTSSPVSSSSAPESTSPSMGSSAGLEALESNAEAGAASTGGAGAPLTRGA